MDLGPIHWLLSIKITCDCESHTISLSYSTFVNSIINHFNLQDAKPVKTPMAPRTLPSKSDSPSDPTESNYMKRVPYREAIGSLMYAAVATHPNIAFAILTLSQFLENPSHLHWEGVKWIFCYLSGTKSHKLTYGNEHHNLLGYADADGGAQEHCRSISGYTFLINRGAISWASRKQELVALSTTKHATKEGIWLRHLLIELSLFNISPVPLLCDNQSTLKLSIEDNFYARMKHINTCYHYIQDVISKNLIKAIYCPTKDMAVDALTKPLPAWKLKKHLLELRLLRDWGGVMELRWSSGHLPHRPILQHLKLFPYTFSFFYLSIPITPSLMPATQAICSNSCQKRVILYSYYLFVILHPKHHFNYLPVSYKL